MRWNRLEETEMGWLGLEYSRICCNKLEKVDNDADKDNDANEDDDDDDEDDDNESNGMIL